MNKYIIEVHNQTGDLISILENCFNPVLSLRVNEPEVLTFKMPADDVKKLDIEIPNELWIRDYATGVLFKKLRITGVGDDRNTN